MATVLHPLPGRRARSVVLVGAAMALVAFAGCGGSEGSRAGGGSSASGPTTTTTTEAASPTPPPSEPTATTTPATTAGSTGPAAPVSVLLVGDSVGFTLQEHVPDEVPGVESVDGRALAGCGLILEGERPPEAVAAGAPPRYDDCASGVADADAAGLAEGPDVVLLVSGAWEWNDHERDGRTVGPGDETWTARIRQMLTDRVESLSSTGATVALWVDPCSPKPGAAPRQAWYRDEVLTPVAEATGAVLVDPASLVCAADGTPRTDIPDVGDPRPDDGQHWSAVGAEWLWSTWLGTTLADAVA